MDVDDIRFKIAASRRILYRLGCDSDVGGHVSARAADGESFWITPFEYFDETTPDRVIRVGFDLELREGEWPASPAMQFHAAIYRARPDVGSVIHTHSHSVSVVASTRRPIGMYNVVSVLFHDDQVVHADTDGERAVPGEVLAATLGDKRVVLIHNHGAIVASQTLERATIEAAMLEKAARYHLACEAAGGTEFPQAEVLRGRRSYERYFLPMMWESNLRRLRRSDPDLWEWVDG